MKNRIKILFLILTLSSQLASALELDADLPSNDQNQILSSKVIVPFDYKGQPYPEMFLKDREKSEKRVWEWSLPFYAQQVIDKGFSLPRPYGLSLVFTHLNQAVRLHELELAFRPDQPLKPIKIVDLSGANADNVTWQAKIDSWIYPFLNAFALLGVVKGTGVVPIAVDAGAALESIAPGYCATHPDQCDKVITASAPIKFNGVNFGLGVIVAAGIQNFFFAMPVTYVITETNVSTENVYSFNMIPRFGYNILSSKSGKFGVYLGANYLDSHASLEGTYSLPLSTTDIGHDVPVRYRIKETPVDFWNAVAGVNWELNERWSLVVELGFGTNREMQTMNFGWRF
ncbi:MAG TPA: hypothetical protein VN132_09405 [Bdellovibrio sp.]|nr:hypothetical protein [Bdellovibrio sp.]